MVKLNIVKPRQTLLPVPEDLFFPPYCDQFIELCELCQSQTGVDPADGPTIAQVVRSNRRAETFDRQCAEALARGDETAAMRLNNASERAAASARSGLQSLKIDPRLRSSKVSRQNAGKRAGQGGTWGELLNHDDNLS